MKKDIARRINKLIDDLSISKSAFGREVGLSSMMVSKITNEENFTNFGVDVLLKIAFRYENLNTNWLISGEGDMYKDYPKDKGGGFYGSTSIDSIRDFVSLTGIDKGVYEAYNSFTFYEWEIGDIEGLLNMIFRRYFTELSLKIELSKDSGDYEPDTIAKENKALLEDIITAGKFVKELNEAILPIMKKYIKWTEVTNENGENEDSDFELVK